jgi:serine phosphatase RsbU (regulator of sigma subunit)
VAFTDGVTEARDPNGEEFGEERLTATIQQWMGGAEQHDDLTFVVACVN